MLWLRVGKLYLSSTSDTLESVAKKITAIHSRRKSAQHSGSPCTPADPNPKK
jgi:hypothetical protein